MNGKNKALYLSFLLVMALACTASAKTFEYKLAPGWNFISLPFTPSDLTGSTPFKFYNGDTLIDNNLINNRGIRILGVRGGNYADAAEFGAYQNGTGYAIYSPEGYTLKVDGVDNGAADSVAIRLKKGWNLVGAPYGISLLWDGDVVIDGVKIADGGDSKIDKSIYSYNVSTGEFSPVRLYSGQLEPWRAYFVKAKQDCTLRFTPNRSAARTDIVNVSVDGLGAQRAISGQVIVTLAARAGASALTDRVAQLGGKISEANAAAGLYLVTLPDGADTAQAAASLGQVPGVSGAVPNIVLSLMDVVPNDPPYAAGSPELQRWGFDKIGAPWAWEKAGNNSQPIVAVLDTGVDAGHPDLAGRVLAGASFVGGSAGTDGNGHGTLVAGVIAAQGNNGSGIAGVCWGCRILPVKVCDAGGNCPLFSVLNGLAYAADQGAGVINVSIAGYAPAGTAVRTIFQNSVNYALGKGAFVVGAAGNTSTDAANTVPASLAGVFAVTATDSGDKRGAFANYGQDVDIAAPGVDILSLSPGGGTVSGDGTSAAAAFVSGAAGLLLAQKPTLSRIDIDAALRAGASPVVLSPEINGGRLDVAKSLAPYLLGNKPPQISAVNVSKPVAVPGDDILMDVTASDPEGDALSYVWSAIAGAVENRPDGHAAWLTNGLAPGKYTLTVKVTDALGARVTGTADVTLGQAGQNNVATTVSFKANSLSLTFMSRGGIISSDSIIPDQTILPIDIEPVPKGYYIELLDASGKVVYRKKIPRPGVVFNDDWDGQKLTGGSKLVDPWLFKTAIPVNQKTMVLKMYSAPNAQIFAMDLSPWAMGAGNLMIAAFPPPWTVTTLLNNGNPATHINLVIMGDGYAAGDMAQFVADANNVMINFFAISPYAQYKSYFNVYRVDVISNQSGVDHTTPGVVVKDTALDCAYDCTGIQRAICCDNAKISNAENQAPGHSMNLVIVNDPMYGGAGAMGWYAATYNGGFLPLVAPHELGHEFGWLYDEYDYVDVAGYDPDGPNCDIPSPQPAWQPWIDDGSPGVGQFAVCTYDDWSRSTNGSCMMNSLMANYCVVCKEQIIKQMYSTVQVIESYAPVAAAVNINPPDTQVFSVSHLNPTSHNLKVQWYLDGAPLGGQTADSYSAVGAVVGAGNHTVEADVYDDTVDVVNDPAILLTTTHAWTLAVGAPPPTTNGTPCGASWPDFHCNAHNSGAGTSSPTPPLARRWVYTTGGGVYSSPAMANGRVYVGSADHKFYAFDENTGAKLWEFLTGSVVYSSAAVDGGNVFFGSNDHKLYARNAVTGAAVWQYTAGGNISGPIQVADGKVFFSSDDNKVYAVDENTGLIVWNTPTLAMVYLSVAVADGKVFAGSYTGDNKLHAFDENTGASLWQFNAGSGISCTPAVADGKVFFGDMNGKIYAVDEVMGTQVWQYPTGGISGEGPAVSDGMVFVGSRDNKVYALNENTGALVWSYLTGGNVISPPSVANGRVFVGSRDDKFYVLDELTGAKIYSYTTGGDVEGSPAVADSKVFIGSWDNKVYAFEANATPTVTSVTFTPNSVPADGTTTTTIKVTVADANNVNGLNDISTVKINLTAIGGGAAVTLYDDGLHGDGAAGDGVYGVTTTAVIGTSPNTYAVTATVTDLQAAFGTANGNLTVTAPTITNGVPCGASWPDFHCNTYNSGAGSMTPTPPLARKWVYTTGGGVYSSPALANGRVFVGSADHKLYALNENTGTKLWEFLTGNLVYSSPAVDGGKVFIGSNDNKVYAIDVVTGAQQWVYTTGGFVQTEIKVSDGMVFAGSGDNKVYALNENTGAKIWDYPTLADIYHAVAVADGKVFVGSYDVDNRVLALDEFTGAKLWEYNPGAGFSSPPAIADGKVFIGCRNNKVYALDENTGAWQWEYTTGGVVDNGAAVADGKVFIGSRDGKVYALNENTGAKIWEYITGGPVLSSPVIANGMVYVGSRDDKFYVLDELTGAKIYSYTTGGDVEGSPAVADSKVFIGSWDNKVYAFEANATPTVTSVTFTPNSVPADGTTTTTIKVTVADANNVNGLNDISTVKINLTAIGGGAAVTLYDDGLHGDGAAGDRVYGATTTAAVGTSPNTYSHTATVTDLQAAFANANGSLTITAAPVPGVCSSDWPDFHCNNANTGEGNTTLSLPMTKRWSFTEGEAIWSSPAVVNGKVYIGTGTDNTDTRVYALDALTGAKLWEYPTGFSILGGPAVDGGVVFAGSNGGVMYALDANTGAFKWKYPAAGNVSTIWSSPAVDGGKVFFGAWDNKMYAVNELTGALIWSYPTGGHITSSPAVDGGKVFFGSEDGSVYAVNENTGAFVWSYPTGGAVTSSPAVANGRVFIGSQNSRVYALNENTGAFIWQHVTPAAVYSSPAAANGRVYVTDYNDSVVALNEVNGAQVWIRGGLGAMISGPAIVNGKVVFGSYSKNMYALDELTGNILWTYKTPGAITSSPAVVNQKIYVGGQDGKTYCYEINQPPVVAGVTFNPNTILADGHATTTVTAVVTDPNGASDVATVTVDLTPVGGNAAVLMYDDGLHGDGAAGDGTYGALNISAASSTAAGVHIITVTAMDTAGATGTNTGILNTTANSAPSIGACSFAPTSIPGNGVTQTILTCTGITDIDNNITTVTVDLTSIGGAAVAALTDMGGGTWRRTAITAASGTAQATYTLTITVRDWAQATGTKTADIGVTTNNTPPTVSGCTFTPNTVPADGTTTTTLQCNVADAENNVSTVTVNLTPIGGGAAVALANMGGGVWRRVGVTASNATVPALYSLTVTATDALAATGTATGTLTVTDPKPVITSCTFVPNSVSADGTTTTTLTCTVTDANNNVAAVAVNLTPIGGAVAVALVNMGGGSWQKTNITAAIGTAANTYNLVATATDAAAGTGTNTAALIVTVPANCVVTTNADGGVGSLRDCINQANAAPGANTITFAPAMAGQTITLGSDLPPLTDNTGGTIINNNSGGEVTISGNSVGIVLVGAITIQSANNQVRGLTIIKCSNGITDSSAIAIYGANATNNIVAGNYIGTNAAGAAGLGNDYGISIFSTAKNNTIGGAVAADRNVISGNTVYYGVEISGGGTDGNTVIGNYIGLTPSGIGARPNRDGIRIFIGAKNNIIGGSAAGERNIISGNTNNGIIITGAGTTGNIVKGNYVGLNAVGAAAVVNGIGINIASSASSNIVGGSAAGERNTISGNTNYGVMITGAGTTGNIVKGNYVGLNAAGAAAVANGIGISIETAAAANTVGGSAAGEGNTVSGNTNDGVMIFGANGNFVKGNFIGTNPAGTSAIGNGWGVTIWSGATGNVVGGTTALERNIISGNATSGVYIDGAGTSNNTVKGNYIGTNAAGAARLDNNYGIEILNGATANTIGGAAATDRNIISGNNTTGVYIHDAGTSNNIVKGNYIGTDAPGAARIANLIYGIEIALAATSNTIGGSAAGERNVISGNGTDGIMVSGAGTNNNVIKGNYVGTNANGTAAVFNNSNGITIFGGANTMVGGAAAGEGNLISGNSQAGLMLMGPTTMSNTVIGNYIGTNFDVTGSVPNGTTGVMIITQANNNTIGGSTAAERNIISGNASYGVDIHIAGTSNNTVKGNYIGVALNGTTALMNGGGGVMIYSDASSNTIGGAGAGEGNVIASNAGIGVYIHDANSDNNKISRNRIYNNILGLGIDIGVVGVGTGADGANNDIQAPVITNVVNNAGNYDVTGTVVCPAAPCTVELFKADDTVAGVLPDPSGSGEGYQYLSSAIAAGAAFSLPVVPISNSATITATLTDANGNTSEFSANYSLPMPNLPPIVSNVTFNPASISANGVDTATCTATITDPNGLPDVATVTVDLSQVGGGAAVVMYDDGLHWDGAAGDGVFGATTTAAIGTAVNTYTITVTAKDAAGLSGTGNGPLTVTDPNPSFFVQQCGGEPSGHWYPHNNPGMLNMPRDATVSDASESYFYVADTSNHRVSVFDKNCVFVRMWGSVGSGDGYLRQPTGITYNPADQNIYVVDYFDRIQVFSRTGTFIKKIVVAKPSSIAIDSSGNVFTSSKLSSLVSKFDASGNLAATWTVQTPYGIDLDGAGNVFVTSSGAGAIIKLDPGSGSQTVISGTGSGPGQFTDPRGIAVDKTTGDIYVADYGNNRVQHLSSAGAVLDVYSDYGAGPGQVNYPEGASLTNTGNLIIVDTLNSRIQEFQP